LVSREGQLPAILTGIGGTMMFVGAMACFFVLAMTVFFGEKTAGVDIPFTETVEGPPTIGWAVHLDRLRYSVVTVLVLIAMAYGPFLMRHIPPKLLSPGYTRLSTTGLRKRPRSLW
jgi:cytochrome c oxidase subunit I